jgi:ribonuclease T1
VRSRGGLAGGLLTVVVLAVALLVVLLRPPGVEPAGPSAVPPGTSSAATVATVDTDSGLRVVALATLPVQARETVARIDRGGPFPYAKDGAVFGNRERLLPARPSGFYREYTVPTPGEDDRGARRIVAGDGGGQLFYTADHYASFVRVAR